MNPEHVRGSFWLGENSLSLFSQDTIVIWGYERNVEEAKAAIEQMVAELQEMVSEDVRLDYRVHARIIGARGKAIRRLMEEFKVSNAPPWHRSQALKFTQFSRLNRI